MTTLALVSQAWLLWTLLKWIFRSTPLLCLLWLAGGSPVEIGLWVFRNGTKLQERNSCWLAFSVQPQANSGIFCITQPGWVLPGSSGAGSRQGTRTNMTPVYFLLASAGNTGTKG
jgi:hypothetical protein